MIQQVIAISHKELKVLWKDKEGLSLLFLMPAFFILVMSFALQGVFESGTEKHPFQILLIDQDRGEITDKIIRDLSKQDGIALISQIKGQPLSILEAEALIRKSKYPLLLIVSDNFSQSIVSQKTGSKTQQPTVTLVADPTLNKQLLAPIEGVIQRVFESHTAFYRLHQSLEQKLAPFFQLIGQGEHSDSLKNSIDRFFKESEEGKAHHTGIIFNTRPPSGTRVERRPSATEQNVPAYTIFGVFFIMLSLASSIYREKADGTFQRLRSAPLSKTTFLLGKLIPYHLVNLIQIALMFSIGVIIFQMKIGSIPALFFVSLSLSLTANGLGLLVAALSRTYAQVSGFSVFLSITLSALGGMMVPAFVMPDILKSISLFTPHAWALAAYQEIIIRGLSLKYVLPQILVLMGFAGLFFSIALWRFRFWQIL